MLDARIVGLDAIAAALRTSPFQVRRFAATARRKRPLADFYRDPLRLRSLHGVLVIRASRLEAWRNRNQRNGAGERKLLGWQAICAHVGLRRAAASVASARAENPLPAVHPADGRVWAYESALTEWCESQEFPYGVHRLVSATRRLGGRLPAEDAATEAAS